MNFSANKTTIIEAVSSVLISIPFIIAIALAPAGDLQDEDAAIYDEPAIESTDTHAADAADKAIKKDKAVKTSDTGDTAEAKSDIVDDSVQLYSYDMMAEDIDELTSKYPDILASEVIGQSYTGKDIYAVTLGKESAPNHIMVQASIHGREYINTQLVMKLLEYYASRYERTAAGGKSYHELFENTAFHVIPMANPDGVTISQYGVEALNDSELYDIVYNAYLSDSYYFIEKIDGKGFPDWEDNYRYRAFKRPESARTITFEEYQAMWKANARGVDLNNNFDAGWEKINLKQYPCYSHYKGEHAESEPETQALVSYATKYDYLYYLSYHSKGHIIYYDCKGNSRELSDNERKLAHKISTVIKYTPVNTKNDKTVSLGGFGDWVQLSLKKPSVTIESGEAPCPVPVEELSEIWAGNKGLWAYLADEIQ